MEAPANDDVLHLLFPGHPSRVKNHDEEMLRSILQFNGFMELEPPIKKILEYNKRNTELPSYEEYMSFKQFISGGLLGLIYDIVSNNNLSEKQYKAHTGRIKIAIRTLLEERNRILSFAS
ncbi:MAG: hypothetical protein IJ744_05975 [Lachnospiraceae bacterium]|nr:hypothetical protein [Lachnospiraceae bacterium]